MPTESRIIVYNLVKGVFPVKLTIFQKSDIYYLLKNNNTIRKRLALLEHTYSLFKFDNRTDLR